MRILALTRYGRIGASSRMRIYQYVPALHGMGIDVQVTPLLGDGYIERLYARRPGNWLAVARDYLLRALSLLRARRFDLLWIEKELFPNLPAWFEQALQASGIRYIVDYDDAIFHNYDLSENPAKRLLAGKIDTVMRHASLVVCGNRYLAQRAMGAGARRVEIVPTVIDLERYAVSAPAPQEPIVVGWIGSPSTAKYLAVAAPALQALAGKFDFRLRVVGAEFSWPGLAIDCRPWSEASEVSAIGDFDIGIMPLTDSPWEHGKCGYKLIQYMACGKPVLASPVGVNRDLVVQDRNGYLAAGSGEWSAAFESLFLHPRQRLAMGSLGRSLVEEKYCLQVSAPRMAQLFDDVLTKRAS